MPQELPERVSTLEALLGRFIVQTEKALLELKREMQDFKEEMQDFKDEMKDFKDEMKDFKTQSDLEFRRMNKRWGELANKTGTLVEDIISPAVRPVLEKYFGEEITYIGTHIRKKMKDNNLQGEFDVIASGKSRVFVIETKSYPVLENIDHMEMTRSRFLQLFPEYQTFQIIMILAALRFDDSFLVPAAEKGIYLMGYREWEYMDLLNYDEIRQSGQAG